MQRQCAKLACGRQFGATMVPMKWWYVGAIALALLTPDMAFEEGCRSMPEGPARRACIQKENPGLIDARRERCRLRFSVAELA